MFVLYKKLYIYNDEVTDVTGFYFFDAVRRYKFFNVMYKI